MIAGQDLLLLIGFTGLDLKIKSVLASPVSTQTNWI